MSKLVDTGVTVSEYQDTAVQILKETMSKLDCETIIDLADKVETIQQAISAIDMCHIYKVEGAELSATTRTHLAKALELCNQCVEELREAEFAE